MGNASKLALDTPLVWMREIVLRTVRDMNPAFSERGCKDARRGVYRNDLVGVPNVGAHIFYRFKLSHAVSGLASAKNRPSVCDLVCGCNYIARVDLFILAVAGRKAENPRPKFGRCHDGWRV